MKKRLKGLGALLLVLAMTLGMFTFAVSAYYRSDITIKVDDECAEMGNVEKNWIYCGTYEYVAVANDGYVFVEWRCVDTNDSSVQETTIEENRFVLADWDQRPYDLCVAYFEAENDDDPIIPSLPTILPFFPAPVEPPFSDIPDGAWYEDPVADVYDRGIMTGMTDLLFGPEAQVTRAQLVTVLWRLEGQPMGVEHAGFPDVDMGSWYGYAVDWAAAFDIVEGYDGLFHPEVPVTREQMAAILYRYTQYVGGDMLGAADLSGYTDADDISDYAAAAMQWAVAQGLMEGSNFELSPKGTLTRAQMAAILSRYLSK